MFEFGWIGGEWMSGRARWGRGRRFGRPLAPGRHRARRKTTDAKAESDAATDNDLRSAPPWVKKRGRALESAIAAPVDRRKVLRSMTG